MKKLTALIVFLALTFPASAQDYDPQHTMLALNMAIVSVHRILTTESRAVLEEEYSNIINNLSLGNIESDRDMTELYRDMLGTITRKRVSEGDSRRLKSYYDTAKQRLIAYALSDIRMSEAKLKAATNAANDAAQDLQRVKNSQYLTVAGWLGKMAVSCVPALWGGNIFLIGKLFRGFSIATAAAATVDSYREYDKTVEPRKRAERNYRISQEAKEQQEIRLARLKEGMKHDEAMLKEELQNSLWKLERQDIVDCNALQERLLQSSWNLLRKYSLPDSYRLTQNTLKNFYRAVEEEDTSRRLRMLRNLEDEFRVYPPYWFYRAKAAQEAGNLPEARKYYAEFRKVWRPVLRRDPYMLETAKFRIQDIVSEGREIEEVRPEILEQLETVYANTPKDDWADNLFMGVAYFLLGEKDKGMDCLAVNLDFGYEEKISGILFAQMEKGALDSDEAQEVMYGWGIEQDTEKAKEIFTELAENGIDMPAIYRSVLDQAVLEKGITVSDAEADQAMKNYANTYFPTREAFYQVLANSGLKPEDYKKSLARQMAADKLMREAIGDVTVSEDKAVEYYEKMKGILFSRPEGFMIHMADFNTSTDAEKFRAKIADGGSWDVVASNDVASMNVINITKTPVMLPSSALTTGTLGVLASLDIGTVSPVFEISSGDFAVAMKVSHVEAGSTPYDEVSGDIKMFLTQQEERNRLSACEESLRQKANIEALYQAGENYYYGRGVKMDNEKAAEYYLQAANAGHANAQYTLGHMYRFGYGVNKDLQKARYWYQQAADQGNATARVQLEDMNKNRE
ncbi:MAG: SEL1-like repeat protein [Synergistaceae bacterium]|nr:SEL1-like repeat protein [Synergistaceae bacterium]